MYSVHDTPCGVGFPIRTFADQRSLASPRDFSQRATSFIASWRQGIHRTLFSRSRTSAAARAQDQTAPDEVSPTRPSPSLTQTTTAQFALANYTHTMNTIHTAPPQGLPRATRWNNVHQIQIHSLKEHARHRPKGPRQEIVEGSRRHVSAAPQPGSHSTRSTVCRPRRDAMRRGSFSTASGGFRLRRNGG